MGTESQVSGAGVGRYNIRGGLWLDKGRGLKSPPRARCRKSIYPLLDAEYILEACSAETSAFLSPNLNPEPVRLMLNKSTDIVSEPTL